ncbi:MAG: hypothetical protein FJX19_04195 [Alphaproteobacteria bacterium]|nr:hypothetical protein [Alphaproteobacteria bacterium]
MRADLAEHSAVFLESIAANQALPLSEAVLTPLAKVEGPLKDHVATATSVINNVFATGVRDEAALTQFRELSASSRPKRARFPMRSRRPCRKPRSRVRAKRRLRRA